MKKLFAGIVTMGLVLIVGGTTIFAAEHGRGRCFTDTDGNGICDNAGSMCIYVDSDGDGICDNCGTYHQCGMTEAGDGNFVDANGDGLCDHYASGQGGGNGRGRGSQRGRGNGFCGGCVR